MIIVLDTTETFSDLRLDGPNFSLLKAYLTRTRSRLVIPQIVVEETVNHFGEQLAERIDAATSAIRDIGRMLGRSKAFAPPNIDKARAIEDFRRYFDMQLREFGGSVISYDKVEIASLVSRALGRRLPFDSKGQKGFRDAVLWESVLKQVFPSLRDGETLVLVTRNSRDFGKEPELFAALREDCQNLGKPQAQVRLFNGLQSFVDQEVKPHLEKLESILREIVHGQYKAFSLDAFLGDSAETLHRAIEEHVQWHELGQLIPFLSEEFHSQQLQSLEQNPVDTRVSDVWRVDGERIAVGIQATFRGELMFQIRTKEFVPSGNQFLIQYKDEPFNIVGLFLLSITAILDEATGAIEAREVDEVQVDFGFETEYGA